MASMLRSQSTAAAIPGEKARKPVQEMRKSLSQILGEDGEGHLLPCSVDKPPVVHGPLRQDTHLVIPMRRVGEIGDLQGLRPESFGRINGTLLRTTSPEARGATAVKRIKFTEENVTYVELIDQNERPKKVKAAGKEGRDVLLPPSFLAAYAPQFRLSASDLKYVVVMPNPKLILWLKETAKNCRKKMKPVVKRQKMWRRKSRNIQGLKMKIHWKIAFLEFHSMNFKQL